ncbi:MAG: glycosyltransferase family 2 protein [Bacteroidales bacterium]|jgi:GT2 family glycosyltransferase|nr:glycosyltransferase family 2 protein [Bacteroidales bacterium]
MEVSIIIVNYNTISLLCDAIDSILEKTTNIFYEIIVVDNNSVDNSANIIPQKYDDRVVYLKLPDNIGFGKANNEGIKIAKGNKLFLLNPDTVLRNNAVKILSDYMDEHPKVGVCGGNLFDVEGNPAYSFMPFFPSILWEINVLLYEFPFKLILGKHFWFNTTKKPKNVAHITGADMMIRKDIAEKTGGFDPDFFMYGEETEWIYRIKKMGYHIVSVPQAEIFHLEGKSFKVDLDRAKMILAGRNLFYKKTRSLFYRFIVNTIYKFTAITRIFYLTFTKNKEKRQLWIYRLKNIK